MDKNEVMKLKIQDYERRKKERIQKLNKNIQNTEENKEAAKFEEAIIDQEAKLEQARKEITKDLTQQSETLQKRLADRKKKLAIKRSVNNSTMGTEESKG